MYIRPLINRRVISSSAPYSLMVYFWIFIEERRWNWKIVKVVIITPFILFYFILFLKRDLQSYELLHHKLAIDKVPWKRNYSIEESFEPFNLFYAILHHAYKETFLNRICIFFQHLKNIFFLLRTHLTT